MGFSCGFVGLPNVGKSTLFNAMTSGRAEAANFPFCTIEPNSGIAIVPDPRVDVLAKMTKSKKVVPATVKFIDIAGLVEGASAGQGLGNKFLGHIRNIDAICHVVRAFQDDNVSHVVGAPDPVRDLELIMTELALADLEVVDKRIEKNAKKTRAGDKEAMAENRVLEGFRARLSENRNVEPGDDPLAVTLAHELGILRAMPAFACVNIGEDQIRDADKLIGDSPLGAYASEHHLELIPVCAKIEAEISQLAPEDRGDFLKELGLEQSGLDRVIKVGYRLLNFITFLTTGPDETRAWTTAAGSTAPQAAGKIHSDLERGFIRMEVTTYEDFVQYGGEQGAKNAGKCRVEGKDYIVQDGDVVYVRFSV